MPVLLSCTHIFYANAPEVVWDYCLEWCALIRSHTALNIRSLDGQVPATKISGDTRDISHLAEFGFWDWVWFVDTKNSDGLESTGEPSMHKTRLGRYLGPAENVGSAMCGTVMTEKGTRIDRTSIFTLTVQDKNSDQVRDRKHNFSTRLGLRLKRRIKGLKDHDKDPKEQELEELKAQRKEWTEAEKKEQPPQEQWDPAELGFDIPSDEKDALPETAEADDFEQDGMNCNGCIVSKVMLPTDGYTFASKVMLPTDGHTFVASGAEQRSRDQEGHSSDGRASM